MAKVKKYPDKKKIKIFRPTKRAELDNGQFDKFLDEEVPEFLARSSDLIIKPKLDNNTLIWMGRDRNFHEKKMLPLNRAPLAVERVPRPSLAWVRWHECRRNQGAHSRSR